MWGTTVLNAQLCRLSLRPERNVAEGSALSADFPNQAGSSSIFLASGSILAIRKLRICPAPIASGFAAPLLTPPFQRACSIELSDEKSNLPAAAGVSATSLPDLVENTPSTPSPNSTLANP